MGWVVPKTPQLDSYLKTINTHRPHLHNTFDDTPDMMVEAVTDTIKLLGKFNARISLLHRTSHHTAPLEKDPNSE